MVSLNRPGSRMAGWPWRLDAGLSDPAGHPPWELHLPTLARASVIRPREISRRWPTR